MELKKKKGFMDSVHGFIKLNSTLIKIIDTPQFQRLRNIKQLGGCYHVFPGASNNRFEHSIGTCFLAGKLVRHLKDQLESESSNAKHKPEITEKEVLCVEVAGLCHDLGHGPFSHVFEKNSIDKNWPKKDWKHEKASCDMLQRLIDSNKEVEDIFKEEKITDRDIDFIKEMIAGPFGELGKYKGRPEKPFLYEIVSNKQTGVDVDKWDYLARDCHYLGMKNTFDHNRYISLTRIVRDQKEEYHIAVRDKECRNLYEMFHIRDLLHRRVYKHKITVAVEEMMSDVLMKANNHVKFKGKSISETVDDMEAYELLNDSVLDNINCSENPDLEDVQNILKRIFTRDLYTYVCHLHFKSKEKANDFKYSFEKVFKKENDHEPTEHYHAISNKLFSVCKECQKPMDEVYWSDKCEDELEYMVSGSTELKEQVFCVINQFDYGCEESNPVEKYLFYKKEKPNQGFTMTKEMISFMLPERFQEYEVVVYNKLSKEDKKASKENKKRNISEIDEEGETSMTKQSKK